MPQTRGIPGYDFFFDQLAQFSMSQVAQAPSAYALSGPGVGNLVTITTPAHGLAALFNAILALGQTPDTPNMDLPLLMVNITGVTTPSIVSSTWVIHSVPLATTITYLVNPAQAALTTGAFASTTPLMTPILSLGAGDWEVALGANGILQDLLAGGALGGPNTNGGGSILPFVPQFGGAVYTTVATGAAAKVSRPVFSDGRSVQLVLSGGAGTTIAAKYR